jgi:hypothetical protein
MVVVAAVAMKDVPELHMENLACASSTVAAKGVRRRTVPRVQKVILASASPMVVEGVANFQSARRVLRVAQSSARRMVEESAAHSWGAPEGLKAALLFARDMEEANAAYFRVVACAQRVCMVALSIVLRMVAGRGVLFLAAPRVLEGVQSIVYAMEVGRDAGLKVAARVHRVAPTSARLTEANAAHGVKQTRALMLAHSNVISLVGARLVCAQLTVL